LVSSVVTTNFTVTVDGRIKEPKEINYTEVNGILFTHFLRGKLI
jgi:hypothetical protein